MTGLPPGYACSIAYGAVGPVIALGCGLRLGVDGETLDTDRIWRPVAKDYFNTGEIDVLVHCAGIWDERPTLDVSEEDWDAVLDTCLKGAFFTMQAVLVPMVESGGGDG